MKRNLLTVFLVGLLVLTMVAPHIQPVKGYVSGKDVFYGTGSVGVVVSDEDCNGTAKTYRFTCSGPNGTIGWMYIAFNASSAPTTMKIDGTATAFKTQGPVNVTWGEDVPFHVVSASVTYGRTRDGSNWTITASAVIVNFTLHFSTHQVWITWAPQANLEAIIIAGIAIVAVVAVAVSYLTIRRRKAIKA